MPIKPVSGKIRSQEINDNLSYLDATIKNIDKGSPKGAYPTLSDLQASFPNGDDGTYVVDGNWYYWDGNNWAEGGVYQGKVIPNKSITNVKLSDGSWQAISLQGAKESLEEDSTRENLVYGSDGSISISDIVNNNPISYFQGLLYDQLSILGSGEFEINNGGHYFYTNYAYDLAGQTISIAVKVTHDDENFEKSINLRDINGDTVGSILPLEYMGEGWYFLNGITLPSNTHRIQLRFDYRGHLNGVEPYVRFTYPTIQIGEKIKDFVHVKDSELREVKEKVDQLQGEISTITVKPGWLPYNQPVDFDWLNHPLVGKIYTDGKGNFEVRNFNISDYMPVGTIYYVDKINGSDDNDGSINNPFATVRQAHNQSDVRIIVVREGIYSRADLFFNTGGIQKELAIIGTPNHEVIFHAGNPIAWSSVADRQHVYQGTRGGALPGIVDNHATDENGDPKLLVSLSSIDEVESTPGSYYHDTSAGIVYVHTYNSETPNNNFIWAMTTSTTIENFSGENLYLQGIKFFGGVGCVHMRNTTSKLTPKYFAKDCEFKDTFSDSYDAVMLQGVSLAISENCVAARSLKDGFNYHWRNGTIPYAIEINCIGRDNGVDSDGSDQGSTIHDGGRIIRINGVYCRNKGANIADDSSINGDTQSWNVGCVGFESKSPYDSQNTNFLAYQDTKMWLDGCRGFGSRSNIRGQYARVRNSEFTGLLREDGIETEYY